jgi:hypothetical protein
VRQLFRAAGLWARSLVGQRQAGLVRKRKARDSYVVEVSFASRLRRRLLLLSCGAGRMLREAVTTLYADDVVL